MMIHLENYNPLAELEKWRQSISDMKTYYQIVSYSHTKLCECTVSWEHDLNAYSVNASGLTVDESVYEALRKFRNGVDVKS